MVLFADLAGYTALCETLDPEEVHLLVRPMMNALRKQCEDLGASVPVIEGDGFMAVFGAKKAAEDDPERALIAALGMCALVNQRRAGLGPRLPELRVGINVGEVLVAPSWESTGLSVSGDAVNVASRLCSAAPPGRALVTAAFAALVSRVEWPPPETITVKNREEPVQVMLAPEHALASRQSGRVVSTTAWQRRDADIEALAADLQARGACAVVGEPGVGKSRLVTEWLSSGASGRAVQVGALSFDPSGARGLLADVAEALLKDVDLGTWGPPPVVARRLQRLVGHAVDTDDEDDDNQLVSAVIMLLREAASAQPLTLVVEDLHWASPVTHLLVDAVARLAVPAGPLTLVVTSRQATVVEDLPVVHLLPLDEQQTSGMVRQLLPGAAPDLVRLLVARTGGLPLFVEQVADLLVENGSVETVDGSTRLVGDADVRQIPTALRLFVAARLDLLDSTSRGVLASAAVLGEQVDVRLLSHLHPECGDIVEALVERGLLVWRTAPGHDAPHLAFRHSLVRDVAYETELKRRRVEIHRAASEWYAVLPALEQFEAQAVHLEAALNLGDPDCELVRETVRALVLWGSSIRAERPRAARLVLARALTIATEHARCDVDVLELLLQLAEVLEVDGDEAGSLQHARASKDLALARADQSALVRALTLEGRAQVLSDPGAAEAVLTEAIGLAGELGDAPTAARIGIDRAILVEVREGWRGLLDAYEEAYRAGQRYADRRLAAHASQQLAYHSVSLGSEHVERWTQASLHTARKDDELRKCTELLAQAGVLLGRGDALHALPVTRRAVEASEAVGSGWHLRNATILATEAHTLVGDVDDATALLADLEALAVDRPNDLLLVNLLVFGGVLAARTGRVSEADDLFEQAGVVAERNGPIFTREVAAYRARALLERGFFVEASEMLAEVVRMDHDLEQPFFSLRPQLWSVVARLAAERSVPLAALSALRREAVAQKSEEIPGVLARWLAQDDLLRGHAVEEPMDDPPSIEAEALDLELQSLRTRDPEPLLRAAGVWARRGVSVWELRALVWHETLTEEVHGRTQELLDLLQGPPDLVTQLRRPLLRLLGR